MRIASIQLAYGDTESVADRTARAVGLIEAQAGADLVVLPELWAPSGFDHRRWQEHAEPLDGPVLQAVSQAASRIGAVVHAGSIIEQAPEGLFNTSVVFDGSGERLATYRKLHRFGFGSGEPRLLQPGRGVVTFPADFDGRVTTVGLATCYDLRFPEVFRALQERGAEIFIVPAAWPAARVEAWSLLGRARAVENQCVTVLCNTAGTHVGQQMGGHSAVIAPDGAVIAEAGTEQEVLTATVDLSTIDRVRHDFPVLRDRRPAEDLIPAQDAR